MRTAERDGESKHSQIRGCSSFIWSQPQVVSAFLPAALGTSCHIKVGDHVC